MKTLILLAALLATPLAAHEPPPYDRDLFGGWIDADGDCEDTRSEVLRAAGEVTGKCRVETVTFVDPYTGQSYSGPASVVDVDHIVPLSEAWYSGAWEWTAEVRVAFANDPLNLVPTSEAANSSKKDRDLAGWLPPDSGASCWYAGRWMNVKAKYRLAMDGDEVAALIVAVRTCGGGP